MEVANAITPNMNTIMKLLSNPTCRIIIPIKINYNLIEVLPKGTCFQISTKSFVKFQTIPENVTPRAFVKYTFNKNRIPYPRPFVQGKFCSISIA